MVIRQRVEGEVEYNDGEIAEVQTFGIEGIDTDLLLETIQIHREDTNNTPEQFQSGFPVGTQLSIVMITEIEEKEPVCRGPKRNKSSNVGSRGIRAETRA